MKPLPDILEIQPLAKPPNCTITVPGSKSITNRALILAALADGKCTLRGALWADDTQVMVDSLQKLGFEVTVETDPLEECNRTITVVGRGGEIPAKKAELYVGNAGTAARFLTALVCLGKNGEYTIRGDARMHERPMKELFDALRTLGAGIEANNDHLPASIVARGLHEGEVDISVERSSQFASAIHLIASKVRGLTIHSRVDAEAYAYVQMTEELVRRFHDPQRPSLFSIEPDLSSASYFHAAAFLREGKIEIADLPEKPLQIDWKFAYELERAHTANPSRVLQLTGQPFHQVSRALHLGDSAMTLAVCAPFFPAGLELIEASNMRQQETDRITALVTELRRVGAEAEALPDGLTVKPGQLHGADIETYNDHRMAMCFAVLGLKVPGIRIKNPGCVSKTFPNFFEKLEQLRQSPSP